MNTGTAINETTATEPLPKFDFPTWLPPMLVKELRQGLRTRGFVASLIGLHCAMIIAFLWASLLDVFQRNSALDVANAFFWSLTGITLGLVTPLRGLGGLRAEIDARNIDLLMLTRLNSWRIVLGKWGSLMAQAGLLVLTLLPYGVVRYFFGSVDLLTDFAGLVWMFVLCGTATALMLWLSGLSRFLRIILVVGFFILANVGIGPSLSGLLFYGTGRRMFWFSGDFALVLQCLILFDLVVLGVFCLLQAVRRLAPPAENHSTFTRLLGLAPLLPLPFLLFFKRAGSAWGDGIEMQSVLSLIGFMLVCVLELGSTQMPMAVQVRAWHGKGWLRAFLSRFLLPGWQSAMYFTAAGLVVFCMLTLGRVFPDPMSRITFLKPLMLVWAAVVFPAGIMSLVARPGSSSLLIYVIVQGLASTLCILAAAIGGSLRMVPEIKDMFEAIFRVLPVSSFWFELGKVDRQFDPGSVPLLMVQGVMLVAVALFAAWRARPYWRLVGGYAAEAKKGKRAE